MTTTLFGKELLRNLQRSPEDRAYIGGYTLDESADSTFSVTQSVNGSETWTLNSRGTDS